MYANAASAFPALPHIIEKQINMAIKMNSFIIEMLNRRRFENQKTQFNINLLYEITSRAASSKHTIVNVVP